MEKHVLLWSELLAEFEAPRVPQWVFTSLPQLSDASVFTHELCPTSALTLPVLFSHPLNLSNFGVKGESVFLPIP